VEAQAVADMVIAVTLGYDWFRDGLTAPQATEVRTFLEQKGVDALIAHLNEEPPPPTAFGTAPGATETAKKKADPNKAKGKSDKADEAPVNSEQMAIASALLITAIGFADEAPDMAKKCANEGAKFFGEGIQRFAPGGVWPEGMAAGDAVMDYASMVIQSLRSASGKDLGLSMLEGIPQFGVARLHLYACLEPLGEEIADYNLNLLGSTPDPARHGEAIQEQLLICSGSPAERLAQLQGSLRCGTQCGSCLPALRRWVATTKEEVSA
jgi:hypothetical protein